MKDIKYYTILILALLIFIFGSIKGYLGFENAMNVIYAILISLSIFLLAMFIDEKTK
jgi:C4-dicarboxylate transporter